jgi:CHASE1-domain containing sensor protein
MSYAGALTAAIRREGAILDIDGLRFERRADIVVPTDYVSPMAQGGGRHTMVYELAGTGKQYRVMIEPVPETHR